MLTTYWKMPYKKRRQFLARNIKLRDRYTRVAIMADSKSNFAKYTHEPAYLGINPPAGMRLPVRQEGVETAGVFAGATGGCCTGGAYPA